LEYDILHRSGMDQNVFTFICLALSRRISMIKIPNRLTLFCLLLLTALTGCDSINNIDSHNLQLTIVASPAALLIGQFSTITATVKNADTSGTTTTTTAASGIPVTFSIVQNVTGCKLTVVDTITDASGNAAVIYKSGTIAGVDVVQASLDNGKTASVGITVTIQ
jgi:hypothetical protein